MPIANFLTDGSTTTQSALSRTLCGMLSGAFKISFITVPASSTLSSSFFCAYAGRASVASSPTPIHLFLIEPPQFGAVLTAGLAPLMLICLYALSALHRPLRVAEQFSMPLACGRLAKLTAKYAGILGDTCLRSAARTACSSAYSAPCGPRTPNRWSDLVFLDGLRLLAEGLRCERRRPSGPRGRP